eukprot:365750-Chlamydomonas_euryale.AAC.8
MARTPDMSVGLQSPVLLVIASWRPKPSQAHPLVSCTAALSLWLGNSRVCPSLVRISCASECEVWRWQSVRCYSSTSSYEAVNVTRGKSKTKARAFCRHYLHNVVQKHNLYHLGI